MLRTVKKVISKLSIIAVIVFLSAPAVYWLFHPELTQMQLFLRLWPYFLVEILLAALFYVIMDKVK